MATKLQCEICGGKLVGKAGGIYECDSCGMEYDTTWVKEKIQQIQGTVKVEGTVEVTGKVQVEGGTVQVDTSANKDALLKRAFMLIQDGEKEKADEILEQVLNIDPECGEAYLGKLMILMKVRTRDTLINSRWFIDQDKNYRKACEYGSPELKAWLEETGKSIRVRIEEANRRAKEKDCMETYEKATQLAAQNTVSAQNEAARLFKRISAYNDSEQQMTNCLAKAEALKAEKRDFTIKANGLAKHRIAVGFGHVVALCADGSVLASGKNSHGQCDVSTWRDITAVAAGWNHTVGLRADGTVIAVGNNIQGQCNVSAWRNIIAIAAGGYFTVGLKKDGTVVATGEDSSGQCHVSAWRNIVAIAAGDNHTLGLKEDGTVLAAGENHFGQCNVSGWHEIVSAEAGNMYSIGLKKDRTVVSTGPDIVDYIAKLTEIVSIAAGCHTVCFLKTDGTVVSEAGIKQLEREDIVAIAVGPQVKDPVYAITEDGAVICKSPDYHVRDWKLFSSIDTLQDKLEQAKEQRKRIEEQKAERRKQEEEQCRQEEERRRKEAAQQRQAELAQKRKELSEKLSSAEQSKQAAETELANLKGLFSGKRRKELEAQIAEDGREIERLKAELKALQ